jgi:molecular chaperone DnaJ
MDLYETLGLKTGATATDIRKAYRRLARRFHPDLNPGDPVAVVRYSSLLRAFDVLSDPSRRAAYDRGELAPGVVAPAVDVRFEGFDFAAEIHAEVAGFREIFEETGRMASGPSAQEGEDLSLTARITFAEAVTGTQRRIHVVRQDHCAACAGSGDVAAEPAPCRRCEGSGQIRARRGHMIFRRACEDCDGSGVLRRQACARCGGEGRTVRSEWLEVQIPAGVGDGSEVRVPGGGNVGRRGGALGDLVLRIEVEAHALFAREGADLTCVVPISITEAALGGHIEVPTPDGSLTIEISTGTQTGQRLRLRGRGLPRLGERGRGDLYVETRIVVARVEDERVRALLEEVARRLGEEPRRALLERAALLRARAAQAPGGEGDEEAGDAPRTKSAS